jgi:hypothetical protein
MMVTASGKIRKVPKPTDHHRHRNPQPRRVPVQRIQAAALYCS